MRIAIIGAFDRMNYGDLLFPVVLTEHLLKHYGSSVEISYYGHCHSDLTPFGGFITKPLRHLFSSKELPDGSVIIVAGGEVLAANWIDTLYYLLGKKPWWQRLANRLVGPIAETILIRRYLGCRNIFPYLLRKSDFSKPLAIIYNAVGGANLATRNKSFQQSVASILKDADYLTVRDQSSIKILRNTGIDLPNLTLAPDCAAVISNLFPLDILESKLSNEAIDLKKTLGGRPFITFQMGINFISNSVGIIAEQLNLLTKKTGFTIVLLPIGRASGHEDQIVLGKILPLLGQPAILPRQNTIFDTMWFIANSQLFIGTSLHGAITAMSYGVPHLALTKIDSKIPAFLNTWDLPAQSNCEELTDIYSSAQNRLNIPQEQLIILSKDFVSKAQLALNRMTNTIEIFRI